MRPFFVTTLFSVLTLAASAQTAKSIKIYRQGGAVDTLRMQPGSTIEHSRVDHNGVSQPDYVTLQVTNDDGTRSYLLSDLDSLVMPTGRTVVFHGYTSNVNGNGTTNFTNNTNFGNGTPQAEGDSSLFTPHSSFPKRTSFSGAFPGGDKVTYYWTENDHIRLDVGNESRAKHLSNNNTKASFYFEDVDFDADSYTVYYPDKQVTIQSHQRQMGANNTEHLGVSGDCGVADALRQDDGSYLFSLNHKVSYLCFLPYIDNLPSARLEKIVLSGGNIAGTFLLSNSGLYNGRNLSSTITLDLVPQTETDFFMGHDYRTEQDSIAAYMVIAPQGSTTFTASYYITDTLSHISKVFHQTFTFAPAVNTVYPIRFHISDKEFRMVDLGLSVCWLNANIGGTIPSDHGTAFSSDEEANAALLDQTVVTQWLMPDEDQQRELLDKCHWTWGQFNGVNGYFVEAPTESTDDGNLHRIFLPSTSTTPVTPEACLAANSRAVETLIVDMGLPSKTKWAVRNVGAQSATDFGDYFAWGETETKSSYTTGNYLYGTRNLGEDLNISGTQHDAAFVHWGGSWRMPTKTEWEELLNGENCSWDWTTINGVSGYAVTSLVNGNKIFLPASGMMYNNSLYHGNTGASYFSANQAGGNSEYAYSLVFFTNVSLRVSTGDDYYYNYSYDSPAYISPRRFLGKALRPVMSTASSTSDGMELTILTDSASWKLGNTEVTLHGSLRSTTPIKGEITVGFVIGDSATITLDETAGGEHNYRWIYSKKTPSAGRITYTLPVYDNIGYWYRAFVQTTDTVMYGTARHYAYEMVNLGLESGTLWANMNLGAEAPEDPGFFYSWGETETKSDYQRSTYRLSSLSLNIGNNHDISGTQYDAAHINMGNAWRMPTYTEMKELYENCVWEHVTQNSTNGYRVTGPNGKSIFLPDAGLMYKTSRYYDNSGGSYWTSTQAGNNSEYTYSLSFISGLYAIYSAADYYPFYTYDAPGYVASRRDIGKPVRAVASLGNIEGDNAFTILTDSATWRLNATSATIYGTMSMLRPVEGFVEVGFLVGDSANLKKTGTPYYSKNVSDRCRLETTVPLYDNMGYWYRAYIDTGDTIFYGESMHFGWEMVDLGLPSKTKWANMNVGASWPEEYGDYYAWAETETKPAYDVSSYRYSSTKNLGNDYNIAGSDMDAAHINMGNVWRMPTNTEAQELLNKCTWTWVLENGVNGYRVTGPNGNSIFLPAAGLRYNTSLYYPETGASYATSVQSGDGSEYAYTLSFYGGMRSLYAGADYYPYYTYDPPGYTSSKRFIGKVIRAVATPNAVLTDGMVLDIQTDSAVWKLNDTHATVYATVASKQPLSDGLTVGVVIGNSSQVDKSSALIDYHQDVTEVCSYSTTVDVANNIGYWYRAYLEKDGEVKYGEAKHFGWEMVDLGLPSRTLWANMNVGANTPGEYGNYFAWGETTTTKTTFTVDNYQYCNAGVYQNIGNNGDIAGTNFDAAKTIMGDAWQMPTVAQCQELLNGSYCRWTATLQNGVKGYWVTSLVAGYEGRRIFLPNAGVIKDSSTLHEGYCGSYQTSKIGGDSGQSACTLTWNGDTRDVYSATDYYPYYTYDSETRKPAVFRYMGRSIRAVASGH